MDSACAAYLLQDTYTTYPATRVKLEGRNMNDFFDSSSEGLAKPYNQSPIRAKLRDWACDIILALAKGLSVVVAHPTKSVPRRRLLIVGVAVPGREADMHSVVRKLSDTSHEVTASITTMANMGKFANIERAIAAAPEELGSYDWLVITDDDIDFSSGLLDKLIEFSERAGLILVQPAHKFNSHASFGITQRHWGSLVRQTHFVEIGPLTLIRRDAFAKLLPFPSSRWCWGIDILWSKLAIDGGWKVGIVDATPVAHLRPVAAMYDATAAIDEARALLARLGATTSRATVFSFNRRVF